MYVPICPTCNCDMQLRSGKFGEFYFCVNQSVCGTKTVSKLPTEHDDDNLGYDSWNHNRLINSLIPNYTEDELAVMYSDYEEDFNLGLPPQWEDFYIGH